MLPLTGLLHTHVCNYSQPMTGWSAALLLSLVWGCGGSDGASPFFVSKSACQSHSKQISKTIMLEGTGDSKSKPKTFTIKTPFF